MRTNRRILISEALEPRLSLTCQVAPIADPPPNPLPSTYPPEPIVPLDPPPPSYVIDPLAPVDVPPPS